MPGTFKGKTFPPGTGNVDAIVPSASSLSGALATVTTTTLSNGADEMGGRFALSFGGEVAESLLYTADESSVEAAIEVRVVIRVMRGDERQHLGKKTTRKKHS